MKSHVQLAGCERHRPLAFVLIELVVVVTIIAILIAIMLPVVQRARREARKDACLSNLHQLGHAITMYASDHDDLIPRAPDPISKALVMQGRRVYGLPDDMLIHELPDVRFALAPYGGTHEILRCPMDLVPDRNLEGRQTFFNAYGSSYTYNERKALHDRKLSEFPHISDNLLMWDTQPFHSDRTEHLRRSSCLFADTRVKTLTERERELALSEDP